MLTRGTAVCGLQREAAVLFNDEGEVRGPVTVHARLLLAHTQRFHGPTDKARQRTAHGVFAGRLGFVASVLQWPGCQVCVAVCGCGLWLCVPVRGYRVADSQRYYCSNGTAVRGFATGSCIAWICWTRSLLATPHGSLVSTCDVGPASCLVCHGPAVLQTH